MRLTRTLAETRDAIAGTNSTLSELSPDVRETLASARLAFATITIAAAVVAILAIAATFGRRM